MGKSDANLMRRLLWAITKDSSNGYISKGVDGGA